MNGVERLARLILARAPGATPTVPGVIDSDEGLSNGTPIVTVTTADARRRAIYLPPHAIQVGGPVFVLPMGPGPTADLVCVASNYQVGGGLGTSPLGTGRLGG